MALIAWSGEASYSFKRASSLLSSLATEGPRVGVQAIETIPIENPEELLEDFLLHLQWDEPGDPPPIDSVLDAWLVDPPWTDWRAFRSRNVILEARAAASPEAECAVEDSPLS